MTAVIQPAVAFVTDLLKTSAKLSHVGDVPGLLTKVPYPVLLTGHCLAVSGLSKDLSSGRLLSFVVGFMLAFGGNLLSCFFLGTQGSSILFSSNQALLIWTASWWLVNHNPIPVIDDLFDLQIVGVLARSCLHILRSLGIASQVNAAAGAYPGVIAPAIVAGTLAGCGGKMLAETVKSISGLKSKFELAHPEFLLRSSVVNSCLVYLLVHVLKAFTVLEGTGLLIVIAMLYTLTDDLAARAVDVSEHVTNVVTLVTLIAPASNLAPATRGRKPTTSSAAATSTPRARSASAKRTRARTPRR